MIPIGSQNNLVPSNSIHTFLLNQAYQNMVNLQAVSSMLIASQEAIKSQLYAMMQYKNQVPIQQPSAKPHIMQTGYDLRPEEALSTLSHTSGSPIKLSPSSYEASNLLRADPHTMMEQPPVSTTTLEVVHHKGGNKNFAVLRAQIEEMVYYILNSIGRVDQAEVEKVRRKYAANLYLIPIFDNLMGKYCTVKKHREDIVRYVIRKALKYLKNHLTQKEKVYGKRAYALLCKKYFHFESDELEKMGINTGDEKELIEFLLPYRKNSKNRTMNTSFTSEIFSSKEFCDDYEKFLHSFETILVEDNNKKIKKLIVLVEECVKNNCPEKIKKCTRLPWLQAWVEKTREVAFDLLKTDLAPCGEEEEKGNSQKRVKIDSVHTPNYSEADSEFNDEAIKLEGN